MKTFALILVVVGVVVFCAAFVADYIDKNFPKK
jgi:hypothetical protein